MKKHAGSRKVKGALRYKPQLGVRGLHGPPSGAEAGRSRRGGCEAGMGHGAPRLKQGRSWGLSSGRAGVTAAIVAACKLAPHDHDQPAERCQRGQCGPPL